VSARRGKAARRSKRPGFEAWGFARAILASGLPAAQKHVLHALVIHADAHGIAWPSQTTLARDTGLGVRTVRRVLARLRTAEILVEIIPGRQHTSARYHLSPAPLAALERAQTGHHDLSGDRQTGHGGHPDRGQTGHTDRPDRPPCPPDRPPCPPDRPTSPPILPDPPTILPERERARSLTDGLPEGTSLGQSTPGSLSTLPPTPPPATIEITDALRARCAMAGARVPTERDVAACLEHARGKGYQRVDWVAVVVTWMTRQPTFDPRAQSPGVSSPVARAEEWTPPRETAPAVVDPLEIAHLAGRALSEIDRAAHARGPARPVPPPPPVTQEQEAEFASEGTSNG
jgi:hypothetical protein